MTGYVYTLADFNTGNLFYVGSTNNLIARLRGHNNPPKALKMSALYKFIQENDISIVIEPLEEIENPTISELRRLEAYWIDQFRAWGFNLVNSVVTRNFKDENKCYAEPKDRTSWTINKPLMVAVKQMAKSDSRSTSNMIEILLDEAIEARKKKKVK